VTTTIEPYSRGDARSMQDVAAGILRGMPRKTLQELQEGRRRALAGEANHTAVSDPDEATKEVEREQSKIRRAALEKFLTDKRSACIAGLSVLDPATQHPTELQAWLDDPRARTLVLVGGTGTGKTQAAAATAAQAARYGAMMWNGRRQIAARRPLIVRGGPVNEYLRQLRPDGSPHPVWKIRDDARRAELLVHDDLGAELDGEVSRFAKEEIADLLDYRLEQPVRQIYTTNLTSDELERALSDRMWSRLQEESTVIAFTGPDRRVKRELKW
jgi:DNA replication protein DnaC